jgi:hypothetical protein
VVEYGILKELGMPDEKIETISGKEVTVTID